MEKPLSAVMILALGVLAFFAVLTYVLDESLMPLDSNNSGKHTIYVHKYTPLHVTVADTNVERQLGLSGKRAIAPNEGMLFVFSNDGLWRIWMKEMSFGIDILWLAEDGSVVDIREYVYPDSYPLVYEPSAPARYILEVRAGYAEIYNIRKGDVIDLRL